MPLSNGRLIGSVPVQAALRLRLAARLQTQPGCWYSSSSGLTTNLTTSSPLVARGASQLRRGYADASKSRLDHQKVDLLALDQKWQAKWAAANASASSETSSSSDSSRPHKYVLPMFPYPSGNLHLGHLRVYAIADVTARYYSMQGHDVLLPMGWDSFGLPAENAAIERGVEPAGWTRGNIGRMRSQLDRMNGSWDWSRQLSTCEPDFYKHTQRIFLLLHKRNLAYQAEAEVNYDPVDKTVLANEQVDAQGRSWRSGAVVEKRLLKQWFFRISEYREALLKDLDVLAKDENWPERVLTMQRNWLGKSTGALVKFPLLAYGRGVPSALEVYTTRIDTLLGVQYVALAASHPVVQSLAKSDPELQAFLDTLPALLPDSKVGYVLPHVRAINPLAYHDSTPDAAKESLPVYVAPYVLGDYGEGAVMGVPGHDVRDHAFWRQHRGADPVRYVLSASEDEATTVLDVDKDDKLDKANTEDADEPYVGHGYMTEHSGPFKGRPSKEAGAVLLSMLEAAGLATATERWRLRDWLVSRQRYWGAPIPIIHCDSCGAVPVPEEDLPVTLPDVEQHFAGKNTGNPLASPAAADWANVPCPECHGPAKRDTDTMDTFVDSSWYYMRFVDPHNADAPFAADKALKSLPVDLYLGGIEHAILHLLYARFIYKVLMTSELAGVEEANKEVAEKEADTDNADNVPVHEPFTRLITQGMVHGKTLVDPETGRYLLPHEVDVTTNPAKPTILATGQPAAIAYEKMSKSKHNGVDPTETIARHGADATRAHMLFQAPVADVLNWDEDKITGVTRWLGRIHDLVAALPPASASAESKTTTVADDLQARREGKKDLARWDVDAAVWREVQLIIASVTSSYTKIYALNTVVSDLMRLSNTLVAAHENGIVTPTVLRAAVSTLVRMLAPITPAFAEECCSLLEPTAGGLFVSNAPVLFPAEDGSVAWLQPRLQNCAVQINGKLRCAVDIPRAPEDLKGDALGAWLADAVLATEEGQTRLVGEGKPDIRQAKKTIVIRNGKLVNFVF